MAPQRFDEFGAIRGTPYLIAPFRPFGSRFLAPEGAAKEPLKAPDESVAAQRAARPFMAPQPVDRTLRIGRCPIARAGEEHLPVTHSLEQWHDLDQGIVPAGKVGRRAA